MQNKSKSCMIHIEDQENAPIMYAQQKIKQIKKWRMKGVLMHGWYTVFVDCAPIAIRMMNEGLHKLQPIEHVISKEG